MGGGGGDFCPQNKCPNLQFACEAATILVCAPLQKELGLPPTINGVYFKAK